MAHGMNTLGWPVLAAALAGACGTERDRAAVAPPSIVLIVADDLGWAHVGYHGGRARTPHIDSLAREGVELERFYVAPMCSPTRAGLLTGRYPIRFGMGRAVITPWRRFGLPESEITLAQSLARAGYEQRGLFGKWHLGHLERRWHPLQKGFTRFEGHYNGAIDYFSHEREGERDWHRDYEPRREQGYSTDLVAAAACRFIEQAARDGPFLCVVAFNAPHAPHQAPDEYLSRYRELAGPGGEPSLEQVLAAMITNMDDGIGRVLAALERAGIAEETLVWFLIDNGAAEELPGGNLPLRGGKLTVFEGGVRVPSAVRWPARLPRGGKLPSPTAYVDVFPTLLEAAGLRAGEGPPLDGTGLLAALSGGSAPIERDLYFYCGQEGPEHECLAVLTPRWKLVVEGPDISSGAVGAEHRRLLFDPLADPGELVDLSAGHPQVVDELTRRLVAFRALEPADSIPPFAHGQEGFVPPKDWSLSGSR